MMEARCWNDPPQLSFSETCDTPGKRNFLNKRVSYPLSPNVKAEQSVSETGIGVGSNEESKIKALSQLSNETDKSAVCENNKETDLEKDLQLSDDETLAYIIETFENILSSTEDKKKLSEINQRINLMKNAWNSKISRQVKIQMYKLSQELSSGNVENAKKIHCVLMVENVREVKQWMVGVKHIIEMKRQCSENSPLNEN